MPVSTQDAPKSRDARVILRTALAVVVSTTSKPVMSMMMQRERLCLIRSSSFSVISSARWESRLPMMGSSKISSQTSTMGVDSS